MSNRFFQYISRIFGGGTVPKSGPSFEELLQKEILQDKTFFITGFRSFEVYFNVEFNDANYALAQSLIEQGQSTFDKAAFTYDHTLETLSVARFKAQDNKEYIALFYDPVDYFSNPELLKIYDLASVKR
ncbi:hypothetical protein AAHN97_19465 [Chitinophaga niabensis]|uniref:hypothetical protein n=1 Tax=Chitinophaga niabensis TaxID=536979 RepID=UPI0031BA8A6C